MPSSIAHASVAVLLIPVLGVNNVTPWLIGVTAVAATLPDLDAIGRPFGHGDVEWLGGHRAVTHSRAGRILIQPVEIDAKPLALLVFALVLHSPRSVTAAKRGATVLEAFPLTIKREA